MNPNVHYRVHNSAPLVKTISDINQMNVLPCFRFDIHFNIIFPPTATYSEWFVSSRLPQQNLTRATCLAHLFLLELLNTVMHIWQAGNSVNFRVMQFPLLTFTFYSTCV